MTADSTAPPRIASLDGIRGCAILLVIYAHAASPQVDSLGAEGVTVFFVLSGFLITTILMRDERPSQRRNIRSFYARRIRRLLPALAVLLFFETTLRMTFGQPLLPVLLAAGYATNIGSWLGVQSTLGHTWSLALEEQFYILWPLILPFLWRRSRGTLVVLIAVTMSVMARAVGYAAGYPHFAWYSPFTRVDAVLVGCALAFLIARGWTLPRGVSGGIILAVSIGALATPFIFTSLVASLYLIPIVALASAIVIAHCLQVPKGYLSLWLSFPPLRWLGRISYAMYLWHPFALAVVLAGGSDQVFILGLLVTVAIGTLSWFVVERPFLRFGWVDVRSEQSSLATSKERQTFARSFGARREAPPAH